MIIDEEAFTFENEVNLSCTFLHYVLGQQITCFLSEDNKLLEEHSLKKILTCEEQDKELDKVFYELNKRFIIPNGVRIVGNTLHKFFFSPGTRDNYEAWLKEPVEGSPVKMLWWEVNFGKR